MSTYERTVLWILLQLLKTNLYASRRIFTETEQLMLSRIHDMLKDSK